MPMLRKRYSMLVELKRLDDVFGITSSSSPGAMASSTLRLPGTLGDEEVGELVVEAAVAPVAGEVLDDREDHLDAAFAAGGDQPGEIGDDDVPRRRVELRPDVALGRVESGVLHVDDEEGGAAGIEGAVARQPPVTLANAADPAGHHPTFPRCEAPIACSRRPG